MQVEGVTNEPQHEPVDPYRSARDLPRFVEMQQQLAGFKTLARFVARDQRETIKKLERQMAELVDAVDQFYELLGPRNWILHDRLNFEEGVKGLLGMHADDAERALIQQYRDSSHLRLMIMPLRHFPGLQGRMGLIERAQEHYEADRFDATVLTLIPVMDGFVNDVEPQRRKGLHTREAEELAAWDSAVGHHMGLSRAHRTFTKSFRKLSNEPVYELYRNGIVHGMLTDYNNDVVATKAWNRLFAVADWAKAREEQAKPKEPDPTFFEILGKAADTATMRREAEAFERVELEPGDAEFEESDHVARSREYLQAWQDGNYGEAAALIGGSLRNMPTRRAAGRAREALDLFPLERHEVTAVHHNAISACDVDVTLTIGGEEKLGRLRWIREGPGGKPGPFSDEDEWVLYVWEPMGVIGYRSRNDG